MRGSLFYGGLFQKLVAGGKQCLRKIRKNKHKLGRTNFEISGN